MPQHLNQPQDQSVAVNRRQFLAGAAAAGLSASALLNANLKAAETSAGWKMKLSTSSLHYRSLPLADACQRIGKLGFEGIDIWSHFEWAGPLCRHLEEGLEEMGPERLAELLKQCGLSLFAASCYRTPATKFAPLLSKLGGCVVVRGSRALQGSPATVTTTELKSQVGAFIESLKPDLDAVGQHQCVLAIENHSGASLLNTLDSIKIFADLNTHPALGVALAPYHIQKNNESVEAAIRACGQHLRFFYAWQNAEGIGQLPGIGPADVSGWIKALAEIDYSGYVNVFMHHEPEPDEMGKALETSRAHLSKVYADWAS